MSEYWDFDNLKTKFGLPESKSEHSVDSIKGKRTCVISFVRSGGLKGRNQTQSGQAPLSKINIFDIICLNIVLEKGACTVAIPQFIKGHKEFSQMRDMRDRT